MFFFFSFIVVHTSNGHFAGSLGGAPGVAAPPGSLNMVVQPGTGGSAFQSVQQHSKPMHTGPPSTHFATVGTRNKSYCYIDTIMS